VEKVRGQLGRRAWALARLWRDQACQDGACVAAAEDVTHTPHVAQGWRQAMPAVVETEEKLHLAFWIKWLTAKGPFGVKAFRISRMRMMTTTTMEGTATALCRTIMKRCGL